MSGQDPKRNRNDGYRRARVVRKAFARRTRSSRAIAIVDQVLERTLEAPQPVSFAKIPPPEIAKALGLDVRDVRKVLAALIDAGVLVARGRGRERLLGVQETEGTWGDTRVTRRPRRGGAQLRLFGPSSGAHPPPEGGRIRLPKGGASAIKMGVHAPPSAPRKSEPVPTCGRPWVVGKAVTADEPDVVGHRRAPTRAPAPNDSGSSRAAPPTTPTTPRGEHVPFAGVYEREQLRAGAERRLRGHLRLCLRSDESNLVRFALETARAVEREARRRIARDGCGSLPALVNHILRSRKRVRIHALEANAAAADARARAERPPVHVERSEERMGGRCDPLACLPDAVRALLAAGRAA